MYSEPSVIRCNVCVRARVRACELGRKSQNVCFSVSAS